MTVPGVRRVERGEGGRRGRLESLFTAHAAAVYAFARRRASAAEAEEVVSETFLVAWRRIDEVPDHELPWLLNVARKTLANRRRGDARRDALVVRLATSVDAPHTRVGADTDDLVANDPDASGRIRAALESLPASERDALELVAFDGLSAAEAALVLGCSRGAIYIRLHRARNHLARRLTDCVPESLEGSSHADRR